MRYSLQFIPVTAALEQALASTPRDRLLPHAAFWCSMDLFDWKAVCIQSLSLRAELLHKFWDSFFLIPRRWRPRIVVELRYDTPARAVCTAFCFLHRGAAGAAAEYFEHVRGLPHGEELYANAKAFAAGSATRWSSTATGA